MRNWFILFLFLFGFSGMAYGQTDKSSDDRMFIDRGAFTVGTSVMQPGNHQFEIGYRFTDDNDVDPGFRSHTFPEMMFRAGLVEDLELRISWDGYTFVHDGDSFANDMSLGVKWALPFEHDSLKLGLLGELALPTGHGDSSFDPRVTLVGDYAFNELWSMTSNLGIGIPTDEFTGDRFAQGTFSLQLNRFVGDNLTLFSEYYTIFPEMDDGTCIHMLQGGLVYMINNNMSIDAFIGAGLNDEAPDFVCGVGFAYRF